MLQKMHKISKSQLANIEIVEELQESIKWIPEVEMNSKWFFAYLNKVNKDIKENLQNYKK